MKQRQNHGRILLPEEAFEALQANTTEAINLEIDKELLNEIWTLSAADKEIQEIRRKKASGTTRDGKIALGLCEENSGLLMYDGLIWIPDDDTLQLRILRDHHDTQAARNPGQARTLELVSRSFYWPEQRKYIHRYVDHCDTCHHIKPIRHVPFGLLKPLELPHRPWDTISTDFIAVLPMSNGKDVLWVIIDRLTTIGTFRRLPGHHEPRRPGRPLPPTGNKTPQTAKQYCIRQRVPVYLRLLETSNGSTRDITQPQHSLPATIGRTNGKSQCHP